MFTERQKRKAIIGVFFAWIIFALAIDRYFLRDYVPWLSNMLSFRNAEIIIQPFSRKFEWLGLTLLLIIPSFITGVILSGYLFLKKKTKFLESLTLFGITTFWFVLIPFFIFLGHVIYNFLKGFLDDWAWAKGLQYFLDGFSFKGDLYIYSFKIFNLDSGLGALVGLSVGILLLYKKGMWEAIKKGAGV